MASRLPLRLRVALAFAMTTAVALVGLGVFVQLRVADTLDDRLADTVAAERDRLVHASGSDLGAAVQGVVGEGFAQLLGPDGDVLASSSQVARPLVDADAARAAAEEARLLERQVALLDTDDEADEDDETEQEAVTEVESEAEEESEAAVLLIQRVGDRVLVVGTSREDTDEALEEVREQLLVGGPVALLLASVLGYVVAGAGLGPIERMRARAATISDRSPGERLPVPEARDELQRLARTLNAMLDRLDEGLQRERRFVAEASHELRTPLALMRTEIELALRRPRSTEELKEALASTGEETERLIALSEDLLVLAAADSDRLTLDREPVDLAALARDVVRRFAAMAEATDRTLRVEGVAVTVRADRSRIDQVLSNLIDNALRHGAGDVEVAVVRRGGAAELTVADRGAGVTEPRPFDRFSGAHGGRGLGLSIVQAIVTAHGGTVTAGSRPDGPGALLTVTLPAG